MTLTTEQIERKIIRRLIRVILAAGHAISVNDGEEWVLVKSRKESDILAAMFSTGEDYWRVRSAGEENLGMVHFVHGNGRDVISDYSTRLDDLINPVQVYSDQF